MNAIIRTVSVLVLLLFSLFAFAIYSTYANKIIVTGYPVFLDDRNRIYYVPDTFVTSVEANFVTLDGTKQVCYYYPQPKLNALNRKTVEVVIRGNMTQWICYQYDENYFIQSP